MASFLTALASIGSQYGQAKTDAADAMAKRQQLADETKMRAAQLGMQQQQLKDYEAEEPLRKLKLQHDLMSLRYLPYRRGEHFLDVTTGKTVDLGPEATQAAQSPFIYAADVLSSAKDPDIRTGALQLAGSLYKANPDPTPEEQVAVVNDLKNYIKSEEDKKQAVLDRQAAATTAEQNRRADAEANAQRNFELKKMMVDFQLNEKMRFMTPQERQQWESIKNLEPRVNALAKFLVDNNLTAENDIIFGDRSALMQHLRFGSYKFGVKQEPMTQEMIKEAAAISIMGAAPWVRIGRGKYTLEQIQQHLPKPTDTPSQLYDKVVWLRDDVLAGAKESLGGLTPPGGGPPIGSEDIPQTTPGTTSTTGATDVQTAPQSSIQGPISPAAQAVIDSYTKKPSPGGR